MAMIFNDFDDAPWFAGIEGVVHDSITVNTFGMDVGARVFDTIALDIAAADNVYGSVLDSFLLYVSRAGDYGVRDSITLEIFAEAGLLTPDFAVARDVLFVMEWIRGLVGVRGDAHDTFILDDFGANFHTGQVYDRIEFYEINSDMTLVLDDGLAIGYGEFTEEVSDQSGAAVEESGIFSSDVFSEPLDFVTEQGAFVDALDADTPTDYVWEHGNYNTPGSFADIGEGDDDGDGIVTGESAVIATYGDYTDAYEEDPAILLVEQGVYSDATESNASFRNNIIEAGAYVNDFELVLPFNVVASGAFTEAVELEVVSSIELQGNYLTTVVQNINMPANVAVQSGAYTDDTSLGSSAQASTSGAYTDAYANEYTLMQQVIESGTFVDAYSLSLITMTDVVENGVFTITTYSILATALTEVLEQGFFTDFTLGGGATGAWTAHLETFAMSRYTEFPFISMAVVDGVPLGTTENGVYRLDADTDAGVAIDARVVHDWTDGIPDRNGEMYSNEYLKHARYLYMGATATGRMGYVLDYVNAAGVEASATYSFLFAVQDGYSTNRSSLGRGVRSRYLRSTLFNIDGADFAINDATLVVELSNRRM